MLSSDSGNGSRMSWAAMVTMLVRPAARALAEITSTVPGRCPVRSPADPAGQGRGCRVPGRRRARARCGGPRTRMPRRLRARGRWGRYHTCRGWPRMSRPSAPQPLPTERLERHSAWLRSEISLPAVQQRSTAAGPLFNDPYGLLTVLSRAQRPLATTLLVVRDEEAAGSNPVTPTVFPQVRGPYQSWRGPLLLPVPQQNTASTATNPNI